MFCIFEIKIIFYLHWFCYSSYLVADDLHTTGSDSKLEIPRQKADRLGKTSHPTKVLDVTFRLDISKTFFTQRIFGHWKKTLQDSDHSTKSEFWIHLYNAFSHMI